MHRVIRKDDTVQVTDEVIRLQGFPTSIRKGTVMAVSPFGVQVKHENGSIYNWGFGEVEKVETDE